jgi:hypothetical protein
MFELRKLKPEDLLEIKDNLIESSKGFVITPEITLKITKLGRSFTYLKDNQVVACVGEADYEGDRQIWALYSNKFSCFTRARAAVVFKGLIKDIGRHAVISIPSDLPNGSKYAEFLGGKFIRTEASKLFSGTNNIYEVA